MITTPPQIEVRNLTIGYDDYVLMKDISFSVNKGDIFIVMGGSGCGKSTLLHVLTGLKPPKSGKIFIDGLNFASASPDKKKDLMRHCGILYQSGALFSSMTLAENIALPRHLAPSFARRRAAFSRVGRGRCARGRERLFGIPRRRKTRPRTYPKNGR